MEIGREFLAVCDELWVFGPRVSDGMRGEIDAARGMGKVVRALEDRLHGWWTFVEAQ